MVIPDNVQMWLIVITVGVFSVVAIVFWLWENVLRLFYEIQRDTGKKYSKIQWLLFCLCGLILILFIIFAWIRWGVNLS